jgi:class 3 adenylate cyclase/DNA-binding NarL/FixJ family response regulator
MTDSQPMHKILFVDDEPGNLNFLRQAFYREYLPILAENGSEALEILNRDEDRDIALILADERMPDISGTVLLKESLQTHPITIRWLITGYPDENASIYHKKDIQIDRYIRKPIKDKIEELKEDVREAIQLFELRRHLIFYKNRNGFQEKYYNLKDLYSALIPRSLSQTIQNCKEYNREKLREEVNNIDTTVLYAVIQNYNSLSEKLHPKELIKQVNKYLGEMSGLIVDLHKGAIMQYTGAGILAVFGIDKESGKKNPGIDAQNAVSCAVDMKKALQNFNRDIKPKEVDEFAINIGINSGEAAVGCLGSEYLLNYTVIGDTVTRATLLPDSIEKARNEIFLSSETFNRARESIEKNYKVEKFSIGNEEIYILTVKI